MTEKADGTQNPTIKSNPGSPPTIQPRPVRRPSTCSLRPISFLPFITFPFLPFIMSFHHLHCCSPPCHEWRDSTSERQSPQSDGLPSLRDQTNILSVVKILNFHRPVVHFGNVSCEHVHQGAPEANRTISQEPKIYSLQHNTLAAAHLPDKACRHLVLMMSAQGARHRAYPAGSLFGVTAHTQPTTPQPPTSPAKQNTSTRHCQNKSPEPRVHMLLPDPLATRSLGLPTDSETALHIKWQ